MNINIIRIIFVFFMLMPFQVDAMSPSEVLDQMIAEEEAKLSFKWKQGVDKCLDTIANYGDIFDRAYSRRESSEISIAMGVVESCGKQNAVGPEGEIGVMQVRVRPTVDELRRMYPDEEFSDDLDDIDNNIHIGQRFREAMGDYHGLELVDQQIVAYNEGADKVSKMTLSEVLRHPYLTKVRYVLKKMRAHRSSQTNP